MLARSSNILLKGEKIAQTPLLIPSFSSKGFPEVDEIITYMAECLTDVTLVSAYDIAHAHIRQETLQALQRTVEILFLDSGGYEAGKDFDLSDAYKAERGLKPWSSAAYQAVLGDWVKSHPTVLVSYDNPAERKSLADQVKQARELRDRYPDALTELLLKPETSGQRYVQVDDLLKDIGKLSGFSFLGFTEKELGRSALDRMQNLAKIRRALDRKGIATPIHVFGSLDTVSTCLYFVAGAEVFDGLSWLRFGFHSGRTVYIHTLAGDELHGTLNLRRPDRELERLTWNQNIYYLNDMKSQMQNYLSSNGDFAQFSFNKELLSKAWDALRPTLEENGAKGGGKAKVKRKRGKEKRTSPGRSRTGGR